MSRRRGNTAIFVVVALTIVTAAFLTAGAATADPFARQVRLRAVQAQALALAEAGVAVARDDLARGVEPASVTGLRVGAGTVDLAVQREGDDLVVRATGRAPAPLLSRDGGALARTIVARLRGAEVLAWEEAP